MNHSDQISNVHQANLDPLDDGFLAVEPIEMARKIETAMGGTFSLAERAIARARGDLCGRSGPEHVLVPLSVVMVLIGVLRYFIAMLTRSFQPADSKVLKEGRCFSGLGTCSPFGRVRSILLKRRMANVPKEQAQNPQSQMLSDSNIAMGMMKKNLYMIITQDSWQAKRAGFGAMIRLFHGDLGVTSLKNGNRLSACRSKAAYAL